MSPAAAKALGHRRKLKARPGPSAPRRVSGPGRPQVGAPRPARPPAALPIPARVVRLVRSMPDRPIVDRLVRGRAWIPVLGVMLAGIVAMQVELLKLNSSIGRAIDRTTALQSRNEQLRASVATLADDQRIERLAAGMGMVMPTPESVVFLMPRASDVQQAVAHMRAPDAAVFAALQPTASTGLPLSAQVGAAAASSGATSTGATSSTSSGTGLAAAATGPSNTTSSTTTGASTAAGGSSSGSASTPASASPASAVSASGGASAAAASLPSRQTTSTGG